MKLENGGDRRFLVTTRLIRELFSGESNMLLLGPWVSSCQEAFSNRPPHYAQNPWDNREKHSEASVYTYDLYEKYLPIFADYLNTKFHVNLSVFYWRTLIGHWLYHFVNLFYDRYELVKMVFREFPDINTILLDKKCFLTPSDFKDFQQISISNYDYYNLQIFSQIIEGIHKEFPALTISYEGQILKKQALITKARNFVNQHLIQLSCKNADIVLHGQLSTLSILQLQNQSKYKVGFLSKEFSPQLLSFTPDYQSKTRKDLANLQNDNEFESLFVKSLPMNFPTAYLEGFPTLRRHIQHGYLKKLPKVFCSIGGLPGTEFSKYYAAEISEQGAPIFRIQHGGNYGVNLFHQVEQHERSSSHRFGCWGWATQEQDDSLMNVPSIKLSKMKRRSIHKGNSNSEVLLVGTAEPQYLYRFWNFPVGYQWHEYFLDAVTFCKAIGEMLNVKVLYRPYLVEYGWNFPEFLRQSLPDIKIDDLSKPFYERMKKARVVVVDHNSTIFLESLVANQPTIIFFNPDFFGIREEVQPYFEKLSKAEILFDNPISAAKKVKDIYNQESEWWESDFVQTARKEFVDHFALTNKDWAVEWARILDCEAGR